MYGMSSKEFWEDDPKLYWSYRTFYLKKLEEEELKTDYQCWLEGAYIFNALNIVYSNMFAKDGEQPKEYFDKPIYVKIKENETYKGKEIDPNVKSQMQQQDDFNKWARY
jgi:hypothetical protein